MQFVSQSIFSTLALNKIFQDLESLLVARLDSLGIVKDITGVIGEYKFVIDAVLASLTPCERQPTRIMLLLTSIVGLSVT